jgi:hypothetical protein
MHIDMYIRKKEKEKKELNERKRRLTDIHNKEIKIKELDYEIKRKIKEGNRDKLAKYLSSNVAIDNDFNYHNINLGDKEEDNAKLREQIRGIIEEYINETFDGSMQSLDIKEYIKGIDLKYKILNQIVNILNDINIL